MKEIREGVHPSDTAARSWDGYSEGFKELIRRYGVERLMRECHFFGTFEDWEAQRRPTAELIKKSGKILDFGCANGFLLACLKEWSGRDLECYGIDSDQMAISRAREIFPEEPDKHFPEMAGALEVLPERFDTIYWNVWDNSDFSLPRNQDYFERLKKYAKGGRVILGFYHEDPGENDRRLEQVQKMGNTAVEVRRIANGHIFAAFDIAA